MFLDEKDVNDIYIYCNPIDFRKGLHGLGAIVQYEFGNPSVGRNLFVFTNSKKNRVKILYWDDSGYAMWFKVLESEKFKWPKIIEDGELIVSAKELKFLLSGIDIQLQKPHQKSSSKAFY